MMKATMKDKAAIVSLLSHAFEGNKSVNYIVRQNYKRSDRIGSLMEYSFLTCLEYGDAGRMNRPVYLETSTETNIPWYQRAGLEIYSTLDFG